MDINQLRKLSKEVGINIPFDPFLSAQKGFFVIDIFKFDDMLKDIYDDYYDNISMSEFLLKKFGSRIHHAVLNNLAI